MLQLSLVGFRAQRDGVTDVEVNPNDVFQSFLGGMLDKTRPLVVLQTPSHGHIGEMSATLGSKKTNVDCMHGRG